MSPTVAECLEHARQCAIQKRAGERYHSGHEDHGSKVRAHPFGILVLSLSIAAQVSIKYRSSPENNNSSIRCPSLRHSSTL